MSGVVILPCQSKTFIGWFTWRGKSFFPPLIKAGRLGLLWSPTNFPGCCPIRAGCQAAAGTIQVGRSRLESLLSGNGGIWRRQEPLSGLTLSSPGVLVMQASCTSLCYSSRVQFFYAFRRHMRDLTGICRNVNNSNQHSKLSDQTFFK